MKKRKAEKHSPSEKNIRKSAWFTVVCDAILVMALSVCLVAYFSRNHVDTYDQNIKNISNIAAAKSELMLSALDNAGHEVRSAYQYCNQKSVGEILDYLSIICDEEDEYQLIQRDTEESTPTYHVYSGYSTKKADGAYRTVRYENTDLTESINLHASGKDGIPSYSQGFTNDTDALRYFAAFCGISVRDGGKIRHFFLVKPQKENKVLDHLQMYSQYAELSTAVCYGDGRYLARDNAFRADSIYSYFYKYNNLSLDQKNQIRDSVQADEDGAGVLEYRDFKGRDCVFTYASCNNYDNWHIFVSVPVSEFVSENMFSFFPLIIIIFLAILLVFNIARLLMIVTELRMSVKREQVANRSKSSFLSRMSHEIRTPLNAVIGYNAIAKSSLSDTQDAAQRRQAQMKVLDCLSKSEIASKHLLTVINDVLDMSAIESGKMKVENARFDFRGLIATLTTVFYSQAKDKDVDFEVVFDTLTEEWFIGDQMRTNQILTNLLSNAVKFTHSGGAVKLKIQQPELSGNIARIHFEVSDTGIGMPEEYLKNLWIPFEQADSSISRRFGGSGLGLSITKSLVDLMGGTISVESEPGVGTTFRVELVYERTDQPQKSEYYDFSTVKALVVDDDSNTCDYIRMLFNRCGASCATVTSGEDALKAISVALKQGERYSVCMVDWRMPGMDGIETIRRIRALVGENLPIIILTAYDFSELADKAAEVGVNKFISKPLFQSSLFDLLANLCGIPAEKSEKPEKTVHFAGERILLAEDNSMNMEIAKTIMESVGLVVDSAWNGMEAVELFTKSAPGTYTVILMDVHMPEMNGHEATRIIRASSHPEAKSIPIIAMTADAFAENVAEAHAAGMNDHISKPIDIHTLLDTIKKYRN